MLDIKYIRENKELVKEVCRLREVDDRVDELLECYEELKTLQFEIDTLKHQKNTKTQHINELKKKNETVEGLIEELKKVNIQIKEKQKQYGELEIQYTQLLYTIPNMMHESVPLGDEDREEYRGGEFRTFDFQPLTNWEMFEKKKLADFKAGIQVAGDRGYVLKGVAVELYRAILQYCTDFFREKGYAEVLPPYFVNEEHLYTTGHYPQGKDEVYKTEDGKVFVGTGEISILAMHANTLLRKKELPLKLMTQTSCFRREAGNHKDDKGLYRTHQFDKLELIHISNQEDAQQEYESMFEDLKELYNKLELPFRIITLRANDMARKAVIERDIELWYEAEQRWGEIGSYGLTNDFQARRGNIRYEGEGEVKYAYTTYATGCSPHRILIGIMNNNQQKNRTIINMLVERKSFNESIYCK
ncbi:MAG: serine--tRNA ligase [Candidatus Nanoarchaeia archaeon]